MTAPDEIGIRVARYDWSALEADIDARGHARLPGLLTGSECAELVKTYAERDRFRSFVDLAKHRFGDKGDYRYFADPLPSLVQALRAGLYPPLAAIANRWQERLRIGSQFPESLAEFSEQCRASGQTRPTPLILRYDAEGYNCLHQDRYGEVAFPLQVACLLSRFGVEADFEGGEFLLVEQRPRMQSRGEALTLAQGEGVVFPNSVRPAEGIRGTHRVQVRHGVSRILSGERYTLGIIFHDAE